MKVVVKVALAVAVVAAAAAEGRCTCRQFGFDLAFLPYLPGTLNLQSSDRPGCSLCKDHQRSAVGGNVISCSVASEISTRFTP